MHGFDIRNPIRRYPRLLLPTNVCAHHQKNILNSNVTSITTSQPVSRTFAFIAAAAAGNFFVAAAVAAAAVVHLHRTHQHLPHTSLHSVKTQVGCQKTQVGSTHVYLNMHILTHMYKYKDGYSNAPKHIEVGKKLRIH